MCKAAGAGGWQARAGDAGRRGRTGAHGPFASGRLQRDFSRRGLHSQHARSNYELERTRT